MEKIRTHGHHDKLLERDLVNILVNSIKHRAGLSILAKIDTDSPARVFKSGFDFYLASEGRIIFIEAKRIVEKSKEIIVTPEKLTRSLTEGEKLFAIQCYKSHTPYYLLVFFREDFVVDFRIDKNIKCTLYAVGVKTNGNELEFIFRSEITRKNLSDTSEYLMGLLRE